jgi:P-type Cu2+ transporter
MTERCFHCEAPIAGDAVVVQVEGQARPVCCEGCAAAARLILAEGLGRYYQFRSAPAGAPPRPSGRHWQTFDREAALRRYTHERADGTRELSLRIEGLHCAACAWLIESSLAQQPGVREIHVNPGSARAEARFDPEHVSVSQLLARIETLGYRPQPLSFTTGGETDWNLQRRVMLQRLGVAAFGMMGVMTYSASLYAGAMEGIAADLEQLLRFVSLVVATPVVLFAAQPFFAGAWRGLRSRTLGMDLPVALSIGSAYLWSVCSTLRGRGAVYYDSAVMFTFLLLLGRYIELALRTRSGMEHDVLARLLPESALRIGGTEVERVLPDELVAGDAVRVLAGERVPADGEIVSGRTEIDESLLTGESAPRVRQTGDAIIAGTMNLGGVIEMRVARVGQDSTLAAMARLLEQARAARPRIASGADRVAGWFVAVVLVLAVLAGIWWWHVDPARAFPVALAVLVVTCPCALSLATPAALAAATTRLARGGLLVARGRALENLVHADRVVFDKTGTLTFGEPRIAEVRLLAPRAERARCLAIAAALERHSEHPIARAFAAVTPASGLTAVSVEGGRGLEGTLGTVRYRIGRADYVSAGNGAPQESGAVILGDGEGALAAFILSDQVRADVPGTVAQLRTLGLTPIIASGDQAQAVRAAARGLGELMVRDGQSAADKLALVRALQGEGHRVVMVGDGVNDAPVLAAADVSVAVGSGTDLAQVSADMVLLGETLAPLALGVVTARRTLRVIHQNMTWAVLYNLAAVPLAMGGYLAPWMAAVGMSASSLLVVLNALRLLGGRAPRVRAAPLPALKTQAPPQVPA